MPVFCPRSLATVLDLWNQTPPDSDYQRDTSRRSDQQLYLERLPAMSVSSEAESVWKVGYTAIGR
jgi:hypothetical protein